MTIYREFIIDAISGWGNNIAFYITNFNHIALADSDLGDIHKIFLTDKSVSCHDVEKIIRPATRKELKAADLWDMVINKDDYSCPEDELESYLDLADEDKPNGLKG